MGPGEALTALLIFGLLLFAIVMLLRQGRFPSARSGRADIPLQIGDVAMTCRVVSEDPVIRVVDGFMTPEECQALIELYEHELKPSTVADDKDNSINRPNPNRTSWSAFMRPGQDGDLVHRIEARAVALTGKPLCNLENLQLVRYLPSPDSEGQHYKQHFDWFHNNPESQRTVTCFVYLNDTDGEAPTRFTKLDLEVFPKQGRACVWDNTPAHGRGQLCDARLEHAGTPVQKQKKYGLNMWWRTLPFRHT